MKMGPDAERLLDAVPSHNQAVRVETRRGSTLLFVPIRRPAWYRAFAFFLPLRSERGFALDQLGEEVWRACDGSRTLEEIVQEFAERHRLRFHEARLSVLEFLRVLAERKLVAVTFRREPS